MNWREVRDATNVRYLLSTARRLGCSAESCLQGSGLDESKDIGVGHFFLPFQNFVGASLDSSSTILSFG